MATPTLGVAATFALSITIPSIAIALASGLLALETENGGVGGGCTPPLATRVASAVDEDFAQRILDLAKRAAHENPAIVTERNFGLNSNNEGGHRVTFLQNTAVAQPALMAELWALSRRGDAWGVTSRRRLPLRCMELIEYASAKNHSLGHHNDGDTLLTVSVLLSTPDVDFEGGQLELVRRADATRGVGECTEAHMVQSGDVVAWRGWEWHRVSPVSRGVRRVLVMEWWANAHAAEEGDAATNRGADSVAGLREALRLEPTSPLLHKLLADDLAARGAARGSAGATLDGLQQAEPHYQQALKADGTHTGHARTRTALGHLAFRRGHLEEAQALLTSVRDAQPPGARESEGVGEGVGEGNPQR